MADLALRQSVYLSRAEHLYGFDLSSFSLVLDELNLLWGSCCVGFTLGKLLWDSFYVPTQTRVTSGPNDMGTDQVRHFGCIVLQPAGVAGQLVPCDVSLRM